MFGVFGYEIDHDIKSDGYEVMMFDTGDVDKIHYNINARIAKLNEENTFPVRFRFVTRNGIGVINFNDMAVMFIYFLPISKDKTLGFLTLGNWDIAQRKVIVNDKRNMLEEIISAIFNISDDRMVVFTKSAYCATVDLEEPTEEKSEEE